MGVAVGDGVGLGGPGGLAVSSGLGLGRDEGDGLCLADGCAGGASGPFGVQPPTAAKVSRRRTTPFLT